MEEEKERLLFDHRLSLRRIFFEKFLIAIILVIAAIAGNFLIEKYKSESTQAQFLLEKKLSSVYDLRIPYSELTRIYYDISEQSCSSKKIKKEDVESLQEKIRKTMNSINEESILFSYDFQESARLVLNLHLGIAYQSDPRFCEYRAFVSDISNHLTANLREELGLSNFENKTYRPIKKGKEQLDKMGVENYLQDNLEKWTVWKSNNDY